MSEQPVAQPASVSVKAFAKINLGLAVIARRGDGYHELETAFARVALADDVTLSVEAAQSDGVALTVGHEAKLPGRQALGNPADNLAAASAKAYLAARRTLEPDSPGLRVAIGLHKRVPVAGGLGGGSADAGAVLMALTRLVPCGADVPRMALALGADVPFLSSEHAAALGKGRGERLAPLELPPLAIVLVNPGLAVSARTAFEQLVGFTPRLRFAAALERLEAGEEPAWPNALQPGVLRAEPQLRGVLAAMRGAGLKGVLMSGSGPTCFGVASSTAHADEVASRLVAENPEWWVMPTRTVAPAELG